MLYIGVLPSVLTVGLITAVVVLLSVILVILMLIQELAKRSLNVNKQLKINED
jgi:hypothetical protein